MSLPSHYARYLKRSNKAREAKLALIKFRQEADEDSHYRLVEDEDFDLLCDLRDLDLRDARDYDSWYDDYDDYDPRDFEYDYDYDFDYYY